MPILPIRYDVSTYALWLNEGHHFGLSRWGDGEWACLLGDQGENCDRHQYFPSLRDDLRRALIYNRAYQRGWLTVAKNAGMDRIEAFLGKLEARGIDITWVDGDVLLAASVRGQLAPFIQALRARRVLYVGPQTLAALPGVIGWKMAGYITVPDANAYLDKERIRNEIVRHLGARPVDVIGFSAGMLSNVLIDELWPIYNHRVTMIDFGSMFDIYCGVRSRSHNRKGNWARLIAKNLGANP